MKLIVLSVYDKATEAYMRPFVAQSLGQAHRMFEDEVLHPDSPISKHVEDYALFHIANFTDHDGKMEPVVPKVVARAHEIQAKSRNKENA